MTVAIASLLALYSLLPLGCAAPHVPSRIIYEDPVNFVRLEEDSEVLAEWPPSHHAHPFTIEPEKIADDFVGIEGAGALDCAAAVVARGISVGSGLHG